MSVSVLLGVFVMDDHETAEDSRSPEATMIPVDSSILKSCDSPIDSFVVVVMREEVRGNSSDTNLKEKVNSSVLKSCESPIDSFVVVVMREEDRGNSSDTNLEEKVTAASNLASDLCSATDSLELKIEPIDGEKTTSVIDLKPKEENDQKIGEYSGGERICRICHLNSDQSSEMMTTRAGLIQLGCGCKNELAIAHGHCAESWFKIRGSRKCEICGETADNVMGVGDYRFMEAWNQAGPQGGGSSAAGLSDGTDRGWCRRQPFCNFLMGCLVIAFVLSWFSRVKMY